jgi:uncharacterized protein YbjT (DUF2867 family)
MKVILFGATGMVGQAALRECLRAPDVDAVLALVRSSSGQRHDKLRELVAADFYDLSGLAGELGGFDVCLFCLGVSAAGMSEADYTRVTYDLTLAAAQLLAARNPTMTFVYVSGAGTDASERGRSMWARVKGKTENALLRLPFKGAYMFRPGFIQPQHGVVSKTRLYRIIYAILSPLYPILRALFPKYVSSSEEVARAMLAVARDGASQAVLENADIVRIGATVATAAA